MSEQFEKQRPSEPAQAGSLHGVVGPRSCKCVRGIGLNGAELGIVKDCPIHGEKSGYRHIEPTECYDGEAD